jgi:hypothetical protein
VYSGSNPLVAFLVSHTDVLICAGVEPMFADLASGALSDWLAAQ